MVEDGHDVVESNLTGASDPSLDADRLAYVLRWRNATTGFCELRLLDITTGEKRVLVHTESTIDPDGSSCSMDYPALDYPWIVWRDVREYPGITTGPFSGDPWHVHAFNAETGEEINLSVDPETGEVVWRGSVKVDLLGTVAVFEPSWGGWDVPVVAEIVSVDLATGERRQLTSAPGYQFWPAITPRWIAWLDQRNAPECVRPVVCRTDIYALDRVTGEERALVIAGDSMQGDELDGEGDWLAYEDQRDGTDITRERDREEDIYAFHLPTMTEVRVTDWPGYELMPRVYQRTDGSYGVLVIEELDYFEAYYRLWDCDLPAF
ncbi:MAG: hypothetical protein QME96_03200 [Myxococcota bacterium]|nr:hypothetical protein [Myxococcota bacterium]